MPATVDRLFVRLAAAIALLASVHGLAYIPLVERTVGTDSNTYIASANALLDGSYSTPLLAGFYYTHPVGFFDLSGVLVEDRPLFDELERQAFRPPGYPAFLALVGGGDVGTSRTLALGAQAVLFGLGTLLLALIVRDWWGTRIALASGLVYAVDPWSKRYVTLMLSEQLAAFLVLVAVYAYTRAHRTAALRWWAVAGVAAGSLTLVRAVFVFAIPLLVLGALLQRRRATAIRAAAVAAVCAAVLVAPWVAWTANVSGRAVLANWGQGFNLLAAAHGEGLGRTLTEVSEDPRFVADLERPHRHFPSSEELRRDPRAHPRYLARADREVRAAAVDEYLDRLGREPLQVAWENVYRAFFLWQAHEDWLQPRGIALVLLRAVSALTLSLALVGLVLALRRGGPARAAAVLLLVYTVVIATHHTEARFAMPVRGLYLALTTAGALFALATAAPRLFPGTALRARTEPSPGSRPMS